MRRRLLYALAGAVVALGLGDVATERIGAHAIVDAPNRGARALPPPELGERRIAVGPPAATLSVVVVEPTGAARATVFCLHGIRDRKENVRDWATHLAAAGYRAVLVDSRGHGRSSGDWMTYGVQESRDLSQLVDALALPGPLAVMGVSYGGATAGVWGGREPRLRAAVAVAPFASLREIVPVYTPRTIPLVGWLIPRFVVMRTVDAAGRLGYFDPDDASPRTAAARARVPILILHGTRDDKVPFHHAELIRDAARDRVTLLPLDGQDHDHVASDPRLWPPVLDFFERALR
jgi:pimeloyl-ACP methyl ester carboxylesterase